MKTKTHNPQLKQLHNMANDYGISVYHLVSLLDLNKHAGVGRSTAIGISRSMGLFQRVLDVKRTFKYRKRASFQKWLATPNKKLNNKQPIDVINSSRIDLVAKAIRK